MISENLTLILQRLKDPSEDVQSNALNLLYTETRNSTGTITPEQQDLFDILSELKQCLKKFQGNNKALLSDIVSVLSMGQTEDSLTHMLKHRLDGNVTELEDWGHQYVRQLVTACAMVRHREIEIMNYSIIAADLVEYLFKHNSETEAIDFIIEISDLEGDEICGLNPYPEKGTEVNVMDLIVEFVDEENYNRVYTYLIEMNRFYNLREVILELTKNKPTVHLVHLIEFKLIDNAIEFVKSITDENQRHQCQYILARCNIYYKSGNTEEENILTNSEISKNYLAVAEDLEIMPSKKIDFILKGLNAEKVDIAAICNGLIHFGFMRDPLFKRFPEDFNIKPEHLSMVNQCGDKAAVINASVGCVYGFNHTNLIEDFPENILELRDLGTIFGVALAGFKSTDSDGMILEMLSRFLSSDDPKVITTALTAISIVYSGQHGNNKAPVFEKLFPLLNHMSKDVICMTIYTLGSIFFGTARADLFTITSDIFSETELHESEFYTLAILGMSLLFYKRTDLLDSDEFSSLPKPVQILTVGTMFVGTGQPDKVEEIMNSCFSGEAEPLNESMGLLAVSLVAVGDPLATQMVENQLVSCLLLNNTHINNIVPVCLSLLHPSSSNQNVKDILERCLSSKETGVAPIVALGILGAGSNNSKITSILNSNFNAMYKDIRASNALVFSHGLINLGKGTLTLSPTVYNGRVIVDKQIIGHMSLAALMISGSFSCFTENSSLLYLICQSISTKYITGVTGEIKLGRPVDTVGLSGNPSKISGKVIHTAPVILNSGEMAETEISVYSEYIEDVLVAKK